MAGLGAAVAHIGAAVAELGTAVAEFNSERSWGSWLSTVSPRRGCTCFVFLKRKHSHDIGSLEWRALKWSFVLDEQGLSWCHVGEICFPCAKFPTQFIL